MFSFNQFIIQEAVQAKPDDKKGSSEDATVIKGKLKSGEKVDVPVYIGYNHRGKGKYSVNLQVDKGFDKSRDYDSATQKAIMSHVEKSFKEFHDNVKPSTITFAANTAAKHRIYRAKIRQMFANGEQANLNRSPFMRTTSIKTSYTPIQHTPSPPRSRTKSDDDWEEERANDKKKKATFKGLWKLSK